MKKMMKKLIAMAAALVMIVTLLPAMGVNAAPAFSTAETGSITINKTTQDETTKLNGAEFTIYKIVGFTTNGDAIQVSDSQIAAITQGMSIDDAIEYINNNEGTIVNGTYETSIDPIITGEEGQAEGQAKFDNLSTGIYVVKETNTPSDEYIPSLPFLVSIPSTKGADGTDGVQGTAGQTWVYDVVATPKNSGTGGGEKDILENEDITYVDPDGQKASAEIGDTVKYQIKATSPAFPNDQQNKKFEISDTVTGLTIDISTIAITVDGKPLVNTTTDVFYTISPETDGETFTINFTEKFLTTKDYKGKSVIVTYDAIVDNDAVIGTDANKNIATIDFGNNSEVTINDKPSIYVYGLQLEKVDASDNSIKLNGVQFELYRGTTISDETKVTGEEFGCTAEGIFTTDDNGLLEIKGLAEGTYTLKEIKTHEGYVLFANPITVEIKTHDAEGATVDTPVITVDGTKATKINAGDYANYFKAVVENQPGFSLPSTGGMGTYLFTIGGIVIMAGAAFALIAMKKRA